MLVCKEKWVNVWCVKVFMGVGLFYNIILLDIDKKLCNCVRFDKLICIIEIYIKFSIIWRGGILD